MEREESYDIQRTVDFIRGRNFRKVALQFPDEFLKDAVGVVRALRRSLKSPGADDCGGEDDVRLFIMADTTYGSCCIDEVGAQHVSAECVVHYSQIFSCMTQFRIPSSREQQPNLRLSSLQLDLIAGST